MYEQRATVGGVCLPSLKQHHEIDDKEQLSWNRLF